LVESGGRTLDPPDLLARVGMQASPRIHDRLLAAGLVSVETGGRAWLVVVRQPDRLRPTAAGEEPRRRVRELLLGERDPDPRTVALAGLVSVSGLVKLLVDEPARRDAERRASELARGEALPEAVSAAIEAAQRATATATLGAQSSIH
jgi:hypothetical protein